MSEETPGDTSGLITVSRQQSLFISWATAVLLNIVVLGLFVEYSDSIVIDSFTIAIFAAVVLKALVDVTLGLEHRARNFFRRRGGTVNRVLGIVTAMAILFSSKFVILEVIDIIFKDDVEIDGFIPLVLLIITMIVAERVVQVVYERLSAGGR
jgi:cell division protein FtsL